MGNSGANRGSMYVSVGVDAWGCGPVSEVALAVLIDNGPNDLAPRQFSESTEIDIAS